jgi:hypothetical protein
MRRLDPAASDSAARIQAMAERLAHLYMEFNELLNWFLGDAKPLASQQANGTAKMMLETGFPASDALEFARVLQRRPRKRPADKRPLAIAALEIQLADARRTWRELAKKTYGCRHEKTCNCGELLRREVGHLKRFLARMRISCSEPPRK